jgi:FAD/FMN-containing dehydrogenase
MTDVRTWDELRGSLRGALIEPDDADYDGARRIWNAMIDKRPAAIARCTGSADVMAAVRFARDQDLPLAVRGGGHNVAGRSMCDDGLVIDLGGMRGVRVDRPGSVVRAAGGALLGDIDHETQPFALAAPIGLVSETGIGGLSLHGGLGFLTRKHGLTADNLVSADVVTADGELVTASEDDHPDLLWALQGGGGGFGVATSFELRLHPVGPEVYTLLSFYPASEAPHVLERFRSHMPEAPDELMAIALCWTAPDEDFIPEEHRGAPVIVVFGGWCGALGEGEGVTRPLREIATPIADLSGPMPFLEVQQLFDPDYPKGLRYYWKSLYLDELSDDVIRLACDAGADRPTPESTVEVWALGGAMGRVPPEATAFYHRRAPFLLTFEANDDDPANDEANVAWVRRWHEDATKIAAGGAGTYFNFGGFWEGGEDEVATAFGGNYDRLRQVKATYDPEGVFSHALPISAVR